MSGKPFLLFGTMENESLNIKDLLWSIQKQAKKVENIFHFQRQKNVFYRSFVHLRLPFLCAAFQHNCISHNHYSDTTAITTIAHTCTTTTLSLTLPLPSLSHFILLYNTNNLFCVKKEKKKVYMFCFKYMVGKFNSNKFINKN